MKKLLTITLSLIISYSFAQWELHNPMPTDANLTDLFYVDNDNGWAVGEYGVNKGAKMAAITQKDTIARPIMAIFEAQTSRMAAAILLE